MKSFQLPAQFKSYLLVACGLQLIRGSMGSRNILATPLMSLSPNAYFPLIFFSFKMKYYVVWLHVLSIGRPTVGMPTASHLLGPSLTQKAAGSMEYAWPSEIDDPEIRPFLVVIKCSLPQSFEPGPAPSRTVRSWVSPSLRNSQPCLTFALWLQGPAARAQTEPKAGDTVEL